MPRVKTLLSVAAVITAAAFISNDLIAQSPVLIKTQAGAVLSDRFRVDSSGAFIAYGFMRDVGNTTGCAAQLPASGAGTRFVWHPCRGSVRFGRAPIGAGATSWDDANMDDFTFAGGNQVIASDYGAFAYGDQVTVSSTVGVGFGSGVIVSGTAGFSAGAQNVCSGFACTAIGYTNTAGGQGSVAIGYRNTANNDYSLSLGYRASNNTHTGTIVLSAEDGTSTDSVRAQADREFRLRAAGGIRLRVSAAANGNTPGAGGNVGCDLTSLVPSWTCASSRKLKENFVAVDGEDVLRRVRSIPITTWNMIGTDATVKHLGPVAEDFYKAFPLGLGKTTIGMGDIDGVNLAAAKALEARTNKMRAEIKSRDATIEKLQKKSADLEARLEKLEALLKEKR